MAPRRTRQLDAREVLYRQGDHGDEMYIILKGKVRLVNGRDSGRVDAVEKSDGEFFGESALVREEGRSNTAMALTPTVLLCINRAELSVLAKDQPSTAARILHALEERRNESHRAEAVADPEEADV